MTPGGQPSRSSMRRRQTPSGKNDHGAVDYEGAKIIAGWPHCPATPEHLETIERPGPTAAEDEMTAFKAKITERWAFAMRRHKTVVPDGKSRWGCPALNGKVGCGFIDGSIETARELGLPIVTPPATKTKFCEQTTVLIPPGKHMKYAQDEYWGSSRGRHPGTGAPTSKGSSATRRTPTPRTSTAATSSSSDCPWSPWRSAPPWSPTTSAS